MKMGNDGAGTTETRCGGTSRGAWRWTDPAPGLTPAVLRVGALESRCELGAFHVVPALKTRDRPLPAQSGNDRVAGRKASFEKVHRVDLFPARR